MRFMRHPNPLVDVRRPRNGEAVGVNPPGFIWKPLAEVSDYRLEVCRDRSFAGPSLQGFDVRGGRTLLVPSQPFEPGRWVWRWGAQGRWSQVFQFRVLPDAAQVLIGSADDLVARLGAHPRAMIMPGQLAAVRARWRKDRSDLLALVVARGDKLLAIPHELAEPPFLDERDADYNAVHVVWRDAMMNTRRFCAETVDLAFAYLVSGERRFAEAAAARLDSLAKWDPDGSTSIPLNDEPHMAVMDGAPIAFDWISDALVGDRRTRIVEHLARRAENTYRNHIDKGYGMRFFGSHSGRMIGFLGQAGIALAGDDPRAGTWLRHILELMVSMYPVWGDADGGWGEGFSYCSAYVRWILRFMFSARTALGMDFYRKPFFRNHARWWASCLPPNAGQTPFGDGGERGIPLANAAAITQHLGRMVGDPAVAEYGRKCQALVNAARTGHGVSTGKQDAVFPDLSIDPTLRLLEDLEAGTATPAYAAGSARKAAKRSRPLPRTVSFPDVGYVAMHSNPANPDEDVCLVIKSSRYGPIGHSHADQNCFVLSAFGQPMAVRTGYYTGYGNPHHVNWVRQTRAHNGLTVNGVGQWVWNYSASGRIAAFAERADYAYTCGDASRAYGDRLTRFHRHVLFVDHRYFLIVDDLEAPVQSTWELYLHSLEPMQLDEPARRAVITRGDARLDAFFLERRDVRFLLTDRFDPPNDDPGYPDLPNQYHLRMTTVDIQARTRLATLLIPGRRADASPCRVTPLDEPNLFGARLDTDGHVDTLLVERTPGAVPVLCENAPQGSLAVWLRDGRLQAAIEAL